MKETEHAGAIKAFAESEEKRIEVELKRRTLEARLRIREAEAQKAELLAIEAELELFERLQDLGVVLQRDENGNLAIIPAKPPRPNA